MIERMRKPGVSAARISAVLIVLFTMARTPAQPDSAPQADQPKSVSSATATKERQFWSFQPVRPVTPPSVRNSTWPATPLDQFILSKLEARGLSPAPEAARSDLIRRVYFDLIGLPPTPEAIHEFVEDKSPGAYERVIDRLLNSPHYGERWGQHWLDVVRYAETEGFEYDRNVPDAWRYRDYVINAFNRDKPYNLFIIEQLAGDEIASRESHIVISDAAPRPIEKNEKISARIGLHETPSDQRTKDDPLAEARETRDLRVAAGFHRLGPVRRNAGNQDVTSSRNEVLTERTDIIGAAFLGLTIGCARCHDHKFDPIPQKDYYRIQAFLAATHENELILASLEEQAKAKLAGQQMENETRKLREALKGAKGEDERRLRQQLQEAEKRLPPLLPAIASVRNELTNRTPIHVLKRGDWENKGEPVGMGGLSILTSQPTPDVPPETAEPRTALALWLADAKHPLTARVMVNRIWLYHFGQGIVKTANDFGKNGDRPSHPELLDYLAEQFIENGWRLKPLHRMICLSKTYRQSSRSPIAKQGIQEDPENRLLWHFQTRRLEAEEIRDAMLAVSGKLNRKAGGPSVILPVDQELVNFLYKPSQWNVTPDASEHLRRSIYLMAKRNLRLPFMEVFDQPQLLTSCARRESSTHAPQALELLNGDTSNALAKAFAERLIREAGPQRQNLIDRAYWLAIGSAPSLKEKELATEFLRERPLAEFALALFNLNEFLYVK